MRRCRSVEQPRPIPGARCRKIAGKIDGLAVLGALHAKAQFAHASPAPLIGDAGGGLAHTVLGGLAEREGCGLRDRHNLAEPAFAKVDRRRGPAIAAVELPRANGCVEGVEPRPPPSSQSHKTLARRTRWLNSAPDEQATEDAQPEVAFDTGGGRLTWTG